MTVKTEIQYGIIILFVLVVFLVQGVGAISISYSETTNTNGAYSSSMGSSMSPLNSNLNIDTLTVTGSGSGSHAVGNESGSFMVDDPPSLDPDFGDIWVKSSPAGAEVLMNGFSQPNLTPMLITMINPGKYTLIIKHEGFEPNTQEIEVIKGKEKTFIADFDGNWTKTEQPVVTSSPTDTKSTGVWS